MKKGKQRKWKANKETRRKLHKNVIHIEDAMNFSLTHEFSRQLRLFLQLFIWRFIMERVRVAILLLFLAIYLGFNEDSQGINSK